MLRTGRRAMVMQIDIYGDNGDELAATATVNFAIINGATPTSGLRADG
jgi:acyl-coenzyme A thioesterase PaaI-like protein